ncbi:amino acid ABC transporter substrate-binding protein [Oculatella sp. LEGE 06141]|uniref:ABC transporter substrate-binding protein n=1 Tax=Oculatella sp. LEGE 06141 TaxID=1828648 RepID=UPI00187E6D16|nr:amino acid ABC transporter substrate-binding protein [Oculatella sp. LEGE 06141]
MLQSSAPLALNPLKLLAFAGIGVVAIFWLLGQWILADHEKMHRDEGHLKQITQHSSTAHNPLASVDRFSSGERVLFKYRGNFERDRGVKAFAAGDYSTAITQFQQAIQSAPNDPESQIYLNNAKARQQGNPYLLAAVVPVDNQASSAEEMVRGVADAQTQFNDAGGDRLLEIHLVNDGNDPSVAAAIANHLANHSEVLGIIGHNSSDASLAALPEYEKVGMAMISPTSTSTELKGDSFFRTPPSDLASGRTLAGYAAHSLTRVVVFSDSQSSYSKSLQQSFEQAFVQTGGDIINVVDLANSGFDAQSAIQSASESGAEGALLFPSTKTVSGAIAIARANAGLPSDKRLQLIGGDALYNPSLLLNGQSAVEGFVLAVPWVAETEYAERSARRWGGQISWRTAMSFDAALAFIHALSNGVSRNDLVENLKQVRLFEATSGGSLQFSSGERGEPILVEVAQGSGGPDGSKLTFQRLEQPDVKQSVK